MHKSSCSHLTESSTENDVLDHRTIVMSGSSRMDQLSLYDAATTDTWGIITNQQSTALVCFQLSFRSHGYCITRCESGILPLRKDTSGPQQTAVPRQACSLNAAIIMIIHMCVDNAGRFQQAALAIVIHRRHARLTS